MSKVLIRYKAQDGSTQGYRAWPDQVEQAMEILKQQGYTKIRVVKR